VRDDRERLADILEANERIEKYAVRGRTALESEESVRRDTGPYLPRRTL